MLTILRIRSALRYLSWADPIYKWRIGQAVCPNCNGRYLISFKPDPFLTRCLKCSANITNLSLIPVINKHIDETKVSDCWEMSTYGATLTFLKANFEHVVESEYFSDKDPGSIVDGILNQDVQNLTFENSSLDLITSNQVFEHVPNDLKGYQECYRVLRPGGALIFSVPLSHSHQTKKLAEIVDGALVFYEEPEYHDSRLGGPKSALAFWSHSKHDICSRVASVGFTTKLEEVFLTPNQGFPSLVIYATKPKSTPPES